VFTEDGHPIAPSDLPSLRVIETGQPELGRVFLLVAEGRRRWLRVSSEPIPSSTGGVAGSVTIYSDVTANRELEEELRRAHRLESIGRLAGGIAHDFNNLLAAILGSVELLQDRIPTAAVEDVATIRHAAERARDLTRQLLAFARKQPARLEAVDLATITGTVEPMLRRLVGPKIEVLVKRAEPAVVRADPSLLEQVLVNLVVNAKEAMPDGGRVEIRVGKHKGSTELPGSTDVAELEVADSGVGMDEATRGQVFDPFFTTKELGTGLGLASSYGIIQQHGGNILVESEPARGTRFRVLLPLLSDP
jgi:two-component system cell cycle sensor histidine kinase/response regulator CckA